MVLLPRVTSYVYRSIYLSIYVSMYLSMYLYTHTHTTQREELQQTGIREAAAFSHEKALEIGEAFGHAGERAVTQQRTTTQSQVCQARYALAQARHLCVCVFVCV